VISWQRRDVNLPPDPILKLMAVASCRSLYTIRPATQRWPVRRLLLSLKANAKTEALSNHHR